MAEIEQILPHIATIHDLRGEVINAGDAPAAMDLTGWTIRMAARCLVINAKTKQIALQELDTEGVRKIPGGGLQYTASEGNGESFFTGVAREISEEIGIDANRMKLRPIGLTIEYRTEWKLVQISYCYIGEIDDSDVHGEPLEDGSHLIWADTPAHALELVHSYETDTYDKKFMRLRDVAILENYISTTTI